MVAVVAVLAAVTVVLWRLGSAESPEADETSLSAWTTTTDGSQLMVKSPVVMTDPAPSSSDAPQRRQDVTGFGAALTESSAFLLAGMPTEDRHALLVELYSPTGPVRLGAVRVALGGSDFVVSPAATYDDLAPGESDEGLERFSTTADEDVIRPVLREILAVAPDTVVFAAPWSPPAWLKTSGTLEGGRLAAGAAPIYAQYLLRALLEYQAAGTPIDYLSVQNEPQARTPDGYPGTDMPVSDQIAVIEALGPLIEAHELSTRILAFDHNWSLHPADRATTPDGADVEEDYPFQVLASDASPWVAGTAFHCYFGDASAQSALHTAFPEKEIWLTECSGSHAPDADPGTVFADTLAWQSTNLLIASLNSWANGVMTWNLALDPDGGPHRGGCENCTGVVTIHPDGTVTRNAEYYVLAHAARFLPPGSTVVTIPSLRGDGLDHVSLETPDGGHVTIAYNGGDAPRDLTVEVGGGVASATVPPHSLLTLAPPGATTSASPEADAPATAAPLDTASASPEAPTDPCCTQDVPADAIDGDRGTRWSTGRPQAPGDWLQIGLDHVRDVRQVVIDAGTSTTDWPRRLEVLTSTDGQEWATVVADAAGNGAVLAVDLDGVPARFIRLQLTAAADPWWSVADVTVLAD